MDDALFAFVMRSLRRVSYKWGRAHTIAKGNARIERGIYECAMCKEHVSSKNINVDHILPVIPLHGSRSLDEVVPRLFCDASGLQILCKPCHKIKTQQENKLRKAYRSAKKK